jgi:hypothetical protein
MKLLVDDNLISYALPAVYCGFKASKHDPKAMSTFDTFDFVQPDLYIASADKLNDTIYKNLDERPGLRVCVLDGSESDLIHPKFNDFKNRYGSAHPWIKQSAVGDLVTYAKSEYISKYKSDIVSIEEIPIPGIENLYVPEEYIFRIFSESLVNHPNYCGFILQNLKKNFYKSSRFSVSGGSNYFNSILCDCYPIRIDEFDVNILEADQSRKLKELKEETINNYTNFQVLINILGFMGFDKESNLLKNRMGELL